MTVLTEVIEEMARQTQKWGQQNHNPFIWMSILMEEVGELAQAALHTKFGGEKGGFRNVRSEAIQVAAVALSFIECLDRNGVRWG